MCIGEPLVWMTPYIYCKTFSSDIKQPFIRAGFAIPEGALFSGFHCSLIHANMLEWFHKWYQNRLFESFREQHSLSFSPPFKVFFAYFDTLRIPRIHRAAVSYFIPMLLHNGRLSAQTLIVTLKATTVDRLNNDWSSKTVSGIQHKQDSTFYQRSLNAANRPHCQFAESATNNLRIRQVGLHNCSYLQ